MKVDAEVESFFKDLHRVLLEVIDIFSDKLLSLISDNTDTYTRRCNDMS